MRGKYAQVLIPSQAIAFVGRLSSPYSPWIAQ